MNIIPRVSLGALCAVAAFHASAAPEPQPGLDTGRIEAITGLHGSRNAAAGVFKIAVPRSDVAVTVDGWPMPPFMGLTSWAAFQAGGKARAMVMGDFVVFEDEVNPVMSAALAHGLEVTALHNHFFFDHPRVFFMHIAGEGAEADLARGVAAMFAASARVRAAAPTPGTGFGGPAMPAASMITAAPLAAILRAKPAAAAGGMVKFVFAREATMACGCPVGGEMGVNTWAAFAGADDNAVVDGDFVVTEAELQGVLRTLRAGGINIVAIHHHMVGETPRLIFLHYWGRGPAAGLAGTLHDALMTTGR